MVVVVQIVPFEVVVNQIVPFGGVALTYHQEIVVLLLLLHLVVVAFGET